MSQAVVEPRAPQNRVDWGNPLMRDISAMARQYFSVAVELSDSGICLPQQIIHRWTLGIDGCAIRASAVDHHLMGTKCDNEPPKHQSAPVNICPTFVGQGQTRMGHHGLWWPPRPDLRG